MTTTDRTPNPLDDFIRPMIGLPAWGVKKGYGSFVTFEFGEPKLHVHERRLESGRLRRYAFVEGRWHVWIYCCHWRIFQDGEALAWSEDADDLIGRAAAELDGQALVRVEADPETGRSSFTFDLGGVMKTWPYGDDPTLEQWMISDDSEQFAFRADGHFSQEPDNTPVGQEHWRPLA
jgi:hypothetical protein